MAKDYYQTLDISRDASDEEVKKAYRKLAMEYHPDRNLGNQKWANEKFKEINEAFGVLGNPEKRRQYDRFGTLGNASDIFGSAHTRAGFEDVIKDFGSAGLRFGFLDDIFGGFFKGKGVSFSFKSFSPEGMRFEGQPGAWTNLEDIFQQGQKRSGARPQDVRYELAISQSEALQGTSRLLVRKGKRLQVRIPPGVKSGSVVKLGNARQITDGEPGDILIQIKLG